MNIINLSYTSFMNPIVTTKELILNREDDRHIKIQHLDRVHNDNTLESSQDNKSNIENKGRIMYDDYKSGRECVDGASRNSPRLLQTGKYKINSQFNTRSVIVQPLKLALEEQLKSLQNKMSDLIKSSNCNLADNKTQQNLLNKVNELRTDFEKCSQLLIQNKNSGKANPEIKISSHLSENTSAMKNRNILLKRYCKKDYFNSTPVVNYEIYRDDNSNSRPNQTFENSVKPNNLKEDAIRKSLTRIIEKNILKMNSNKSTERKNQTTVHPMCSSTKNCKNGDTKSPLRMNLSKPCQEKMRFKKLNSVFNKENTAKPNLKSQNRKQARMSLGNMQNLRSQLVSAKECNLNLKKTSRDFNHEQRIGKDILLCSPRGQELIKKYQGRYKMIDLNSSMSMSRQSSSSKRDGHLSRYASPLSVQSISTTNAKEFRKILKLSIRKDDYESADFNFNSEKEVKMNDIEDDLSSRKESVLTKMEFQTEPTFDKESSSKKSSINIREINDSNKNNCGGINKSHSKSSLISFSTMNPRTNYKEKSKNYILHKRRNRENRGNKH